MSFIEQSFQAIAKKINNILNQQEALFNYTLRLADTGLVLGQRLAEWCGHGPTLEQDIALTNTALDLIGHARYFYQYAGEIEGKGRSEDDLAYLRDTNEFKNVLLVEIPNGHFGTTIMRQFLFDAFNFSFLKALTESKDTQLAGIAKKAVKEVAYHLKISSEWVIRLGDGTQESQQKMQGALEDIWMYSGDMFIMDAVDEVLIEAGIAPDLAQIKEQWTQKVDAVLYEATLKKPKSTWMQKGGKVGLHTEHLSFLLAEMQSLKRRFPTATW